MTEIVQGQVWRRKPAGYLYRITGISEAVFGGVELFNLHDYRKSTITPSGLLRKFERAPEFDTAPPDSAAST